MDESCWAWAHSVSSDGLEPDPLLWCLKGLFSSACIYFSQVDNVAEALTIEYGGKEVIEDLSLLLMQSSPVSGFLPARTHIIPSLSFVCKIPKKPFLWSYPARLISIWTLAFLTLSLASQIIFLHSFQATYHVSTFWKFPIFLKSDFAQQLIIHPWGPPGMFA